MYTEKADPVVLRKCWKFIESNKGTSGDNDVSKNAVDLCSELIASMLASHKEFEDAVRAEVEKIEQLENGFEKEAGIIQFNNLNFTLQLDQEAQNALNELIRIRIKNKVNG